MKKLLIAEDDPLMSRMYARAFLLTGHDFTIAKDGEEALAFLRKAGAKPDLAVLDIMMPRKSGFDVLSEMKKDPALKDIPVVFLTNLAEQQDAKKGLELGAIAYLVKSEYSPQQIVEKIDEIMDTTIDSNKSKK